MRKQKYVELGGSIGWVSSARLFLMPHARDSFATTNSFCNQPNQPNALENIMQVISRSMLVIAVSWHVSLRSQNYKFLR